MTIDVHKVVDAAAEQEVTKLVAVMFLNEAGGMPREEALAKFEDGVILLADVVEAAHKRLTEIVSRSRGRTAVDIDIIERRVRELSEWKDRVAPMLEEALKHWEDHADERRDRLRDAIEAGAEALGAGRKDEPAAEARDEGGQRRDSASGRFT